MRNQSNTTELVEYFMVGWFKYPKDLDINYDVIELLYNIFTILSLPLNLLFLAMIIKNPGSKTRSNMSIILASLSTLNIVTNGLTTINYVSTVYRENGKELISIKVLTCVLAISFTKYFFSMFLLALITYGMIVEPLRYKVLSPKPRNMLLIIMVLWLASAGMLLFVPLLIDDFAPTIQNIVVIFCWLLTFIIMAMYYKIIITLWRRRRDLQRTLNVAASRQGLLVIKQNSKLAVVLFLYILSLVLLSLPIGTSVFLLANCPSCDYEITMKFIIYSLPQAVLISMFFPIHWMLGTAQYCREMKRLALKLLKCYHPQTSQETAEHIS
jgi:hypothetical protein